VKQMEDEEGEDNGTAPHHGARSVGGSDVGLLDVGDGPRLLLEEPELEGRPDVQDDGEEEGEASAPEWTGVGLQEFRVVIDFLGRLIDLEIAEQVANDKAEEDEASDGHDGLLADSGLPETKCARRKRNRSSAHRMDRSLW